VPTPWTVEGFGGFQTSSSAGLEQWRVARALERRDAADPVYAVWSEEHERPEGFELRRMPELSSPAR